MGGRDRPESVVAFNWNAWSRSPGIGGRNRPEYAGLLRCPSSTVGECPYRAQHAPPAGLCPMIKCIPMFAQDLFQTLCSADGALCHPVRQDRRGWDYLVEFPEPSLPGPPDTHPGSKKAYVQVKSAEQGGPLTCPIRLSNALRSTNSHDPWFIVLIVMHSPRLTKYT
jgi:hypothetical protein